MPLISPRKALAKACFSILFVAAMHSNAEEKLVIPIYDKHQPPLIIQDNDRMKGIYIDLFKEILSNANIKARLLPTPKKRARILFEQGDSIISCCDNPVWRKRPLEQRVQLFSDAFYKTQDVFVFPPDQAFPIADLSVLSDKSIAVIRGYGYRGSEWFGDRIDFDNESTLLTFVSLGRANVGIVNEDIAKHWLKTNPGKIRIQGYHDNATLHIRVHRNREDLLTKINAAIQQVTQSGKKKEIIDRYLK